MSKRILLITGATGNQGGAVVGPCSTHGKTTIGRFGPSFAIRRLLVLRPWRREA